MADSKLWPFAPQLRPDEGGFAMRLRTFLAERGGGRATSADIDGFYNVRRPHLSLDRQTPDEAYFDALQPIPVAA